MDVLFECEEGLGTKSLMQWAIRWRVPKSKVDRFFRKMQKDKIFILSDAEEGEGKKRKPKRLTACKSNTYKQVRNDNTNAVEIKNKPESTAPKKVTNRRQFQAKLQLGLGGDEMVSDDYKECLDSYFAFYKNRTGVKPKMSPTDGGSLKSLIEYFNQIIKDDNDDKKAVDAFNEMFDNWNKLDSFLQNQLKLTQINNNINNIINLIKNNVPKKSNSNPTTIEPQDFT